ncbi:hypothetical protein FB451DRAFT_1564003 [Mycena latifolia]|nr:hypothetical protein FB451DRAFT_1564003 [Mycena latifolia]
MTPFRIRKLETPAAVGGAQASAVQARAVGNLSQIFFQFTDRYGAHMSGLKPNTPEYIPLLRLKCISRVAVGLMGGEVYVAEITDAAPKIAGCAVWYGPGARLAILLVAGPYRRLLFPSYDDDLMKWLPNVRSPRVHDITQELTAQNLQCTSNLETIRVDPEYHRQGVGRLLVDAVLKKAVLTNTPLVVECTSEITLQFYQSVGFKGMPVPKGGEERRQEFTSFNGEKLLALGSFP